MPCTAAVARSRHCADKTVKQSNETYVDELHVGALSRKCDPMTGVSNNVRQAIGMSRFGPSYYWRYIPVLYFYDSDVHYLN